MTDSDRARPWGEALIRLEDAAFRVGSRTLLRHTHWEIRRGQNWAVLGPNGAGKSTLLAGLAGRAPVVAGRLRRLAPEAAPEALGYVAMGPQQVLMAREDSAAEARAWAASRAPGMTAGRLLAGPGPTLRARQVGDLLDLEGLAPRELRHLSSGEWRRLLIARALMPEPPRLLVLDEPFDGLDQPTRIDMTRFLADLMAAGIQLVMATHRGDELPPGIAHHLVVDGGRAAVAGGMVAGPRDEARRRSGTAELPAPSATAPQAPPVLVELRQATVGYGPRRILDRLTWRHRRGEHWAILGPNGAGKTTLLRLIAGDHPQVYANDVRLMGKRRGSGETRHQVRADIAMTGPELQMAYQRPLAVRDVVLSGLFDSLGLFRRASSTQLDRAGAWLAAMGLERMAQTDFRHLSGGQQRLALMARAMIKDPLLLILDEPCEGLDAQNRRRVLDCLDALAAQGRTHLLYVSHHPEDLPACISHVLHLAPGGAARQQARQKGGGEDGR